jgi:hypothetical protein
VVLELLRVHRVATLFIGCQLVELQVHIIVLAKEEAIQAEMDDSLASPEQEDDGRLIVGVCGAACAITSHSPYVCIVDVCRRTCPSSAASAVLPVFSVPSLVPRWRRFVTIVCTIVGLVLPLTLVVFPLNALN